MARTIDQIYNAILIEKAARPELAGVTSASATAIWRHMAYLSATAIWVHEKFFDAYRADLQQLVDSAVVGTGQYYVNALRVFQSGDTLSVLPSGRLGYEVVDETKRIIALASYVEQAGGIVLLKAAKLDNGSVVELAPAELMQAIGYVNRIRFAGVRTTVISEPADLLRAYVEVYYNSLIDIAVIRARVEDAVKAYLKTLSFDGAVYASRIQDAIQRVDGVEDVKINTLSGVSSLGVVAFDRIYRTRAGYIEADTTAGFTLADTLNFIGQ
jgi:hypothetical protein